MIVSGSTDSDARGYDVREANSFDISQILELLRANLSDAGVTAKTEVFWRWKHVEPPAGPSIVYVATASGTGQVIGLRAAMRVHVVSPDGSFIQAVRPVDTATNKDWQRMGVFSNLTLGLIHSLRDSPTKLLFNTPNDNSLPAYLRLGWHVAQTNKLRVKLGNPLKLFSSYLFSGVNPSSERVTREGVKQSIDRFAELTPRDRTLLLETCSEYERLRTREGMRTLRDACTLAWRYSCPSADYSVFRMRFVDSVRPDAVVFFRYEWRRGIRGALLTDFFYDTKVPFDYILKSACRSIKAGFFVASAMDGTHEDDALARRLFLPVKNVKLAQRLVKSDNEELPAVETRWDVSLADLELF